ncbi:hypothetical protein GGR58DRAFT_504147 [Xylaria digitata]|nr:hypothetical protein GGR58DRAFT_504147 [Xylaria digitata]
MKINNPSIPLGSLVAVVGANGYIALEVCQKLLEAGYRVRGTVRDVERCSWMHRIFDKNWPGRLELVRVQDFEADGAFDEAFEAYYIDVEDTARLLVAAVALSSVQNERIFAYFGQGTWNDLRHKVRTLFPNRSDIVTGEDLAIQGRDLSTAHKPIRRARDILQEVGQSGFVSEDEMLRKFAGSMYVEQE